MSECVDVSSTLLVFEWLIYNYNYLYIVYHIVPVWRTIYLFYIYTTIAMLCLEILTNGMQ